MKNYLFLILLAALAFSCSGENESMDSSNNNIFENFSFSVDTVVVDPGEEIINLSRGVRGSSLDETKTYFYLFDEATTQINKINLDELVLEEQIPFEKEGPNGIGANYITTSRYMPGEEFLFSNFQSTGIFNKQGKKVLDLTLKPEEIDIEGLGENEKFNITSSIRLSPDRKWAYSLPSDFMEGTTQLAKINLETKKGAVLPIPALDIVGEYQILLQSGDGMSIYREEMAFQEINDKFFISGATTNSIYRFESGQDSLDLFEYDFSLVPNQKQIPIRKEVSSMEEFRSEMEKANTQIGFEKLLYDEKTKRFFRFGRIYEPREDPEAPRKAQVFLFAFDENLNFLGETEIPQLDQTPSNSFFKDGKLWSYVNVDDELGFAVFDFKF
ncbi:DUF4221 domain-containing protein [Algoriphagus kandeliae]|uniref:DUF4221 domain-containing protein n=1 Tax=Algoriphagus kandeliae TaxID=2562278 RepID=A0A4Y9QTD9_9BACT|nr:DUF4221 family protein [Algoriphagus kandeliae]TFV95749.1 DUF4221 domain-containing protein [Algoriphagus kandeliae]